LVKSIDASTVLSSPALVATGERSIVVCFLATEPIAKVLR